MGSKDRPKGQLRLCEQRKLKRQQVTLAKILHSPPRAAPLLAAISSRGGRTRRSVVL